MNTLYSTVANDFKSSARDDEDQIATIDKAEYHVLIIFSNVRENMKDDISSFISTLGKFSSLKLLFQNTMKHSDGIFHEEWFKMFYGEKYYLIFDTFRQQQLMVDHKGASTLHGLSLKTHCPFTSM